MRLFRRGGEGPYYAQWYGPDGARHQRSTRQLDRKAAEAVARGWERSSADPAVAAANETTVAVALSDFVSHVFEEAKAGHGSLQTADFYARKAGHPLRLLGANTPLARVDAGMIDAYVTARRGEGASEHTLSKELTTLRQALALALRRGKYTRDPGVVVPKVSARYRPKERWLTLDEVRRLLEELTPDHAAQVAWMVAVGGDWSAVARALRSDVAEDLRFARVRGSKRETRDRVVPVVLEPCRELLAFALREGRGQGDVLFRPWGKVCRDISVACARAKIDHCSPNDFRRTHGHWLRAAGVPPHLIALALGHATSAMAEQVYARPSAAVLSELLVRATSAQQITPPSASEHCSDSAADGADSADHLDGSQRVEKREGPANLLGLGCRRWDLNLRPWDYDAQAPRAIAAVKPRQNRKAALRAADMQRDEAKPPVLRLVKSGGRR